MQLCVCVYLRADTVVLGTSTSGTLVPTYGTWYQHLWYPGTQLYPGSILALSWLYLGSILALSWLYSAMWYLVPTPLVPWYPALSWLYLGSILALFWLYLTITP